MILCVPKDSENYSLRTKDSKNDSLRAKKSKNDSLCDLCWILLCHPATELKIMFDKSSMIILTLEIEQISTIILTLKTHIVGLPV